MHKRKNFIFKNEPFVCKRCNAENPLIKGEIRDHCRKCLSSLHVDSEVPGDRESNCLGLMTPKTVYYNKKKGYMIQFECESCGKQIANRVASDDNYDLVCEFSTKGYDVPK